MGKIRVLQDNIINLIAAGEVIERPASVIKELVENSIDAAASEILIKVEEGGLNQITVIDNGTGMEPDDAELAFTQHATSKVYAEEDLQNIHTLGFRGEALASISSVAEVQLETKASASNAIKLFGAQSRFNTGKSAQTSSGTTITISQLFKDVPARKKFLRTASTEWNHIVDTFISISLVNLGIHFELWHNGKLSYRLPKTDKFAERVFAIWDERTAKNLYQLEFSQQEHEVKAYLGNPDIARKDRKVQYVFVNNRYVSDRTIQKAIAEAYRGFIHKDLQPVYFLMLNIPADQVDVNVHPRKLEVRFANNSFIYGLVYNSVRSALERQTKTELMNRVESREPDFVQPTKPATFEAPRVSSPRSNLGSSDRAAASLNFAKSLLTEVRSFESPREFTTSVESTNLMQLFATYIVYQQGEDVVFIDQHAAAEKITYEKLVRQLDHTRSRPLLVPEILEFRKEEKEKVLEFAVKLGEFGVEISDFGGNSIQVTALPELTPKLNVSNFLQELISKGEEYIDVSYENIENINPLAHRVIATLACHGSIRAGQKLVTQEMQQIVSDLGQCKLPYNCPHGRPVSWKMQRTELEKNFKRII